MLHEAQALRRGGYYHCAVFVLYSLIDSEMRSRLTDEQREHNRPIEDVFPGPDQRRVRDDLHKLRLLANMVKHDQVMPTPYETDKALWVCEWLFGPDGPFERTAS